MSQVVPQIIVAPNWRLRDHAWMERQNVKWVLKYVDKQSPRVEEVDADEDESKLSDRDYSAATIMSFDTLENEEVLAPGQDLPRGLLNHLPHGIGFVLMAKTLMKDEAEQKLVISSPRGRSRAPAVLAAALILGQKVSAQVAVTHVMTQHQRTKIGDQLLAQLGAFESIMSSDEQKQGFYRLMSASVQSVEARLRGGGSDKKSGTE